MKTIRLPVLFALGWLLGIAAAAHETPDGVPHEHAEDAGGPTSVFAHFPTAPDFYREPVAALIREGLVERFGEDEFAAVVLSHEIHQHIGIYTIIGAKMGVRARELLEAPRRAVEVVVETQPDTPPACAVDGLQASLGSTYGQDLIRIQPVVERGLTVTFTHGDRRLRVALKDGFKAEIQRIVETNATRHGDLSPAYFEAIRAASYRIWAEWDRAQIFEEDWLDAGTQ